MWVRRPAGRPVAPPLRGGVLRPSAPSRRHVPCCAFTQGVANATTAYGKVNATAHPWPSKSGATGGTAMAPGTYWPGSAPQTGTLLKRSKSRGSFLPTSGDSSAQGNEAVDMGDGSEATATTGVKARATPMTFFFFTAPYLCYMYAGVTSVCDATSRTRCPTRVCP